MRALLRRSDWLVASAVLGAIGLTWVILLGFDLVTAFAGKLDDIGDGDFSLNTALLYTLYTLPRRAYELFPHVVLIGCIMGLGSLASTSELTALRAAGLSRLRICLGASLGVLALTMVMVIAGETLGPAGERRAQAETVAAKSQDLVVASWSGLWAREADTFLNAKRGTVRGTGPEAYVELSDVRLFSFDSGGRLASLAVATRAEHRDGQWQLFDVRRTRFLERSAVSETAEREVWNSQLSPELLNLSVIRPRYLALRDIQTSLDYMRRNQLDTGQFEAAFWARLFFPVNVLVLGLAVMPFAFGTLRSGGFGKRLFLGIAIGLGYSFLQRVALNTAEVYGLDLRFANALPPLLLATASWLYFRRSGQH